MLVRVPNREDPDQTAFQKQSDLGLHGLLILATCVVLLPTWYCLSSLLIRGIGNFSYTTRF